MASSQIAGACGVDIICFNLEVRKQFTVLQTGSQNDGKETCSRWKLGHDGRKQMRVINGTSPSVWKAHTNNVIEGSFLGSQVYCIFFYYLNI